MFNLLNIDSKEISITDISRDLNISWVDSNNIRNIELRKFSRFKKLNKQELESKFVPTKISKLNINPKFNNRSILEYLNNNINYLKKLKLFKNYSNALFNFIINKYSKYIKSTIYYDINKNKPKHISDHLFENDTWYIDHGISHAIYSKLTSNFIETDILMNHCGDGYFNSMFIKKDGSIIDLSSNIPSGKIWTLSAELINIHYTKLIDLIPYGIYNSKFNKLIENIFLIYINTKYIETSKILTESKKLILSEQDKMDFIYTLDFKFTELILEQVLKHKSSNNLCIAGGSSNNGYVNELLLQHYDNVHVPPAYNDEGISLGCLMHKRYFQDNITERYLNCAFIGNEYEIDISVLTELDKNKLTYKKYKYADIYKIISSEISNGKIIGWYQGRSEHGPRALGNRSILADPRNPNIKDILNKLKKSKYFKIYNVSVLESEYKKYFDTKIPSPFMSRIVPVKKDKRHLIPGVTHIDGTARIGTVTKEFNEHFYNLISEFNKITDIPMLLNTSFNLQEPIVERPIDAINTFIRTKLDILVLKDYIVYKKF